METNDIIRNAYQMIHHKYREIAYHRKTFHEIQIIEKNGIFINSQKIYKFKCQKISEYIKIH